jgi:hypothetical protein
MPNDRIDIQSLSDYQQRQARSLIESALVEGALPSSILLAQFVHVAPENLKTNFEITTAVKQVQLEEVACAIAWHAGFVKKSKISFFERALYTLRTKGLICMISSKPLPRLELDFAEYLPLHLQNKGQDLSTLPIIDCHNLEAESIQATEYAFVSEKGLYALIQQAAGLAEADEGDQHASFNLNSPKRVVTRLEQILGHQLERYFSHILPLTALGDIILCVPLLYLFEQGSSIENGLGGGGCLFLIKDRANGETLRRLYMVTHKLCSMISGIVDVAQVSSRREATETGTAIMRQMTYVLQHEYNNTNNLVQALLRPDKTAKKSHKRAASKRIPDPRNDEVFMILNLMSSSIEGLDGLFDLKRTEALLDVLEDISNITQFSTEFPTQVVLNNESEELRNFRVPQTYRLVLAELVRNAFKKIDNLPAGSDRVTCLKAAVRGDAAEIIVENSVSEDVELIMRKIDSLNSYTIDLSKLVFANSRPEHFGLKLSKDIVRRSNGALRFAFSNGKFQAILSFPVPKGGLYA